MRRGYFAGKLAGVGLPPVTLMVKSPGPSVPPSSLTTWVITRRVPRVGRSSAVTVQVFVSPAAMVPPQSAEKLVMT